MHAVRHGLRLNADAMPPDPEKILQIHDFLGFGVSLRFLPTFTLILSLATLTLCPLCGGTMRVIADITDPDIIEKILDHIEAQPPPIKPATAIQS